MQMRVEYVTWVGISTFSPRWATMRQRSSREATGRALRMGKSKRRRKLPGHFCWACGRRRPNERFSGKGHARHVCRDCQKLGPAELKRRQIARNLDRLVNLDGIIPRRHRQAFEGYLTHSDPDVRAAAEAYQRIDADNRAKRRVEWEELRREEARAERIDEAPWPERFESEEDDSSEWGLADDLDIPF